MPFFRELLVRSLDSFLHAVGTTGLGFITPILVFLLTIILTLVYILFRTGKDAMRQHWKETAARTAGVTILVMLVVHGPIFAWQLFHKVPKEIDEEARLQKTPIIGESTMREGDPKPVDRRTDYLPKVPPWAYESSPPTIAVSMEALKVFTFLQGLESGQKYLLGNKKEYELKIRNESRTDARSVNLRFQFPQPWLVVTSHIIERVETDGARYQPPERWVASGNGSVQTNGCFATGSYLFTADDIKGGGMVDVRFLLEEAAGPTFLPPSSDATKEVEDFVYGKFRYSYRGESKTGKYYAELKLNGSDVTLMPQSSLPPTLEMRTDLGFAPPPCIPSEVL